MQLQENKTFREPFLFGHRYGRIGEVNPRRYTMVTMFVDDSVLSAWRVTWSFGDKLWNFKNLG